MRKLIRRSPTRFAMETPMRQGVRCCWLRRRGRGWLMFRALQHCLLIYLNGERFQTWQAIQESVLANSLLAEELLNLGPGARSSTAQSVIFVTKVTTKSLSLASAVGAKLHGKEGSLNVSQACCQPFPTREGPCFQRPDMLKKLTERRFARHSSAGAGPPRWPSSFRYICAASKLFYAIRMHGSPDPPSITILRIWLPLGERVVRRGEGQNPHGGFVGKTFSSRTWMGRSRVSDVSPLPPWRG